MTSPIDRIPFQITAYRCLKCNKMHHVNSKKGQAHIAYMTKLPPNSYIQKKEKP